MNICNLLVIFRFGFESWSWVLIVSVPDLCILFPLVLEFTAVFIIFLIFALEQRSWVLLEPLHRTRSNDYPTQSMFKREKIIYHFFYQMIIFTAVKPHYFALTVFFFMLVTLEQMTQGLH